MLKRILSAFQKSAQTASNPQEVKLEFAFACGNKRYYTFASEMDLPVMRALAAKDIYTELEQGIDREYLENLFTTCEELLDKGKLSQAAGLIQLAKARTKHISNLLLLYKLASVLYVEEGENPYKYDWALNEKKIENWLACEEVEVFFSRKPIKKYLPSYDMLATNIKSYFKAQGIELQKALQYHLSLLSEKPENEALRKSLTWQEQQISRLIQSLS